MAEIIGISVGVAITLLLIGIGIWMYIKKKRKKQDTNRILSNTSLSEQNKNFIRNLQNTGVDSQTLLNVARKEETIRNSRNQGYNSATPR